MIDLNVTVAGIDFKYAVWYDVRADREATRVKEADRRVAAWAHWQRSSGVYLGYPPESPFVRVRRPTEVEEQAGARHVACDCPDDEAMQVDGVFARWRLMHRRRYRILRTEFLYHGPAWEKAARHGMKRDAWRARVDQTLGLMADELGIA